MRTELRAFCCLFPRLSRLMGKELFFASFVHLFPNKADNNIFNMHCFKHMLHRFCRKTLPFYVTNFSLKNLFLDFLWMECEARTADHQMSEQLADQNLQVWKRNDQDEKLNFINQKNANNWLETARRNTFLISPYVCVTIWRSDKSLMSFHLQSSAQYTHSRDRNPDINNRQRLSKHSAKWPEQTAVCLW